jgi:hypothetical protein
MSYITSMLATGVSYEASEIIARKRTTTECCDAANQHLLTVNE